MRIVETILKIRWLAHVQGKTIEDLPGAGHGRGVGW
jgi:hypothetical protein